MAKSRNARYVRDGIRVVDRRKEGRKYGRPWQGWVRDARAKRYIKKAFFTEAEARQWAEDEQARLRLGLTSGLRTSMATVRIRYLAELERRGRTPLHVSEVGRYLLEAEEAGVRDLGDDDLRQRVRNWINQHRHLSARTRNKRQTILHGAVRFAVAEGLIHHDPLASLRGETDPAKGRTPRLFSPEDLRALVGDAMAGDPYFRACAVLAYTGMRLAEMHAMRWQWIDWDGGVIHVRQEEDFSPKRHQERHIPLQPELRALLQLKPGIRGPLFPELANLAKPADRSRAFAAYTQRAGIDRGERGAHRLRHTWVSYRLALGASTLAVRREAGHSTVATTEKYAHQIPAGWLADWPRDGGGSFWLRRPIPKTSTKGGALPS